MTELVVQKTARPTRKILAVILSGAIMGALQAALGVFWPDHPFAPVFEDLDHWIQAGVMILAGYYTKEKADVPVVKE